VNIIIDLKNTDCVLVFVNTIRINTHVHMETNQIIMIFILRSQINKDLPTNTRQPNRQ